MKLLMIGPVYPYRGGISHYTAMLWQAMEQAGHEAQIISFRRQYPGRLYPGSTDKDPSQKPLAAPAEFLLDPIYVWTWIQAASRIRTLQPDAVVIQWWTTFWGPAFSAISRFLRKNQVNVIYIIHNVLPHEQRWFDRGLARTALSQGNAFIVQTPAERKRLLELLPDASISLCPLPTYHHLNQNQITREEARKSLRIDESRYLLLFFGFVRAYKGVHVLIEALGKLRRRGLQPMLAVVGEFWQDRNEYQAQIEKLGLADQVRIEDRYIPDEEIGPWFQAADCLVAPYTAGTQSAAVGIALAYGLPMIVSRQVADGIADQNQPALLGVIPPNDAEALAQAIQAVMNADRPSIRVPLQPTETAAAEWQNLVAVIVRAASKGGNA